MASDDGSFKAFKDRYEWEVDVVQRATYFTTTWFYGRRTRERPDPFVKQRFDTLREAIAATKAPHTARTVMVYAVTAKEESTMLAPADWPKYLQLRGEAK